MVPFYKSRTVTQFVPFMLLVLGGSFLVREFTKIRYKYRRITTCNLEEETKAAGIKMKKVAPLEQEYEETMKKIDIDNWENVRIPRPWEEPSTTQ